MTWNPEQTLADFEIVARLAGVTSAERSARPGATLAVTADLRRSFGVPSAADHDEVVKQMRECRARDSHAQFVGVGEVGRPPTRGGHETRLRRLSEDDVALGPVQRPPLPHPSL